MFWPYYIPWQYTYFPVCQQAMPELTFNQQNIETVQTPKPRQNSQSEIANKFSIPFKIELDSDELGNAGYQTGKNPWTEQQDILLKELVRSTNSDWRKIAASIPGRNEKMCYSRYRRIRHTSRNYWKHSQDELLIKLVQQHGFNWKHISASFQDRSPKILKQHYVNQLAPNINKEKWTLEQDKKFIELLNTHGRNWKLIVKQLQGRTVTQLKNRFFGRIKRLMEQKLKGIRLNQSLSSRNDI